MLKFLLLRVLWDWSTLASNVESMSAASSEAKNTSCRFGKNVCRGGDFSSWPLKLVVQLHPLLMVALFFHSVKIWIMPILQCPLQITGRAPGCAYPRANGNLISSNASQFTDTVEHVASLFYFRYWPLIIHCLWSFYSLFDINYHRPVWCTAPVGPNGSSVSYHFAGSNSMQTRQLA